MLRGKWFGSSRRAWRLASAVLIAAVWSTGILTGCSETSLNEAPIVDLSTRAGPSLPALEGTGGAAHASSAAAAGDAAPGFYTVQKGDTLFRIAAAFHCSVSDLARWNSTGETTPIFVGQRLRIAAPASVGEAIAPTSAPAGPASSEVVEASAMPVPLTGAVETRTLETMPAGAPAVDAAAPAHSGETGSGTAPASPPVSALLPGAAGRGGAPTQEKPWQALGWIWPVQGRVTGSFDAVHTKGIEILVIEDAQVVAVADGEVSYTGSPRDYGKLVILRHPDGLLSVYAHNKSILVQQGQTVKRGQSIATAGKTGPGPAALHFEVRRKGNPVDPLEYLPPR